MKFIYLMFVVAITFIFGGCSGGSSGGNGSGVGTTTSPVQGVFQGTISTGYYEDALILEDGSFWTIYGSSSGSGLSVYGISEGTSTAGANSFSVSYNDFPYPGSNPISGNGTGIYTTTSLIGTVTESNVTSTFNLTTPVLSTYNYNTPAILSAVSGTWTGSFLDGETGSILVQSNGALSGTSSLGCSFTGTITPRPSGVNIFNMSISFGAFPCVLANQTVSGVALTYPLSNGTYQLIAPVVNSANTRASAFFAVR